MTAEELIQIAENEPRVYDAGKAEGVEQGIEQGIEQGLAEVSHLNDELEQILYGTDTGGKSFYDEFWDNYQQNGTRTDYNNAFGGSGWNEETFKPKYKIAPTSTNAYQTFSYSGLSSISFDKVDMSKAYYLQYTFYNSTSLRTVEIDVTSAANLMMTFQYSSNLTRVYLKNLSANCAFNNAFAACTSLTHLEIEGTIGKNGFDVSPCTKLSKASITSIINALSTTTSGLTVTLSKTAVNNAFTTDEWNTLIATKKNWTISLV